MKRGNNKSQAVILSILLSGLIFSLFLLNATPPISRDALIHHLAIPKLYLQNGGIYEIPDLVFSYYPMNLDLLYTGALYFNNDIVPKYIHLAFGLATAFLLYRYLQKRISPVYGLLGALFFLSVPIVIKLATTVYVDLGLVFFTTASLLFIFKWCENQFASRFLILAGICCGLAVGTKYNGLLVLFLLSFLVPFVYLREAGAQQSALSALKYATIFFFFTLLLASPWFIRNSIWTGNPIYPLYDSMFNLASDSASAHAVADNKVRGVFATRYVLYGENLWQLLALPIRIFFEGVDGDPRFFDGRLNPFLLILPGIALIKTPSQDKRVRTEISVLLVFSILYFLFAFNTSVLRIRYLVPIVPFLVILSIYGLHRLTSINVHSSLLKQLKTPSITLLLVIMFSYNGIYLAKQFHITAPLSYISGEITRDEYLYKKLPEFKVMQYANDHLAAHSKILCVFMGKRGYYLDFPLFFDNHKTAGLLLSALQQPDASTDEITERLGEQNITNLLIRSDLLENWLKQTNPDAFRNWIEFKQTQLLLLFKYSTFELYELVPKKLNHSG